MMHIEKYSSASASAPCTWEGAWRVPILAVVLACLLAGCVTDNKLLADNSKIAQKTAEKRAMEELGCPQVKTLLVAEKEVPGTPLGELYSQYNFQASGCGKQASYDLECRDQKVCSFIGR